MQLRSLLGRLRPTHLIVTGLIYSSVAWGGGSKMDGMTEVRYEKVRKRKSEETAGREKCHKVKE